MTDQKDQKPALKPEEHPLTRNSNAVIADDIQAMLNTPVAHSTGIDPKDEQFLQMLVGKIEAGEIKLLLPSSLLNLPVYDKLDEMAKGKADVNAYNLLSTIREIYNLWKLGHKETFQIANLVHQIRVTKERLEEISGDIYII